MYEDDDHNDGADDNDHDHDHDHDHDEDEDEDEDEDGTVTSSSSTKKLHNNNDTISIANKHMQVVGADDSISFSLSYYVVPPPKKNEESMMIKIRHIVVDGTTMCSSLPCVVGYPMEDGSQRKVVEDKLNDSMCNSNGTNNNFWNNKLIEPTDYKRKFKHTNVPTRYTQNKPLGTRVSNQRREYKHINEGKTSSLTNERIESMNKLGFVLQIRGLSWEERRQQLVDFYNLFNHTNVQQKYTQNKQLGCWVYLGTKERI